MATIVSNSSAFRIALLLMQLGIYTFASAQETLTTSGGDHTVGPDRITYTIGQPVFNTVSTGNGALTQGFQQPWALITSIAPQTIDAGTISVFPNPVQHQLQIRIEMASRASHYALYDAQARLLGTAKLTGPITLVDMEALAGGEYLLHINGLQNEQLSSHKIIVTN